MVDATYSDTIAEQLGKLSGAQVKPHFSRTYLSYHDTITFEGIVENASGQILPPHGTKAVLHIHKVVDTKDHTQVSPGDYDAYFSLEPQEVAVSHNAALFTLSSRDRSFTLEGEIEYILPLLGKRETKITSDRFTITANEAYLDIEIQQDGVPVATIEGAEKKPYTLSVRKKTTQSDVPLEAGKVRIIDDLTLEELFD